MNDHLRNGHATGRVPADSPERSAMHALADEVRRLAAAMVDRDMPVEVADHAAMMLRTLTDRVASAPTRDFATDRFHSTGFVDFSPVGGLANPVSPPLSLRREPDGTVSGMAVFSAAFEGPPAHVHGGVLSAAFDEVLGLAQTACGLTGMTGRLTVHFRRPTPIGVEVRFTGKIRSISGRKVVATGESRVLSNGEWVVTAESDGLFISMPNGFKTLAGEEVF